MLPIVPNTPAVVAGGPPRWAFAVSSGNTPDTVTFSSGGLDYRALVWRQSNLTTSSVMQIRSKGLEPFSVLMAARGGAGGAGGNQAGAGTAGGGGGGNGGLLFGDGPTPASLTDPTFTLTKEINGLRCEWTTSSAGDTVLRDGGSGGNKESVGGNALTTSTPGLCIAANFKHPGGGGGGGGAAAGAGGTSSGGAGGAGSTVSTAFRGGGGGGTAAAGAAGSTTGNGGDGVTLTGPFAALMTALGFGSADVAGGGGGGCTTANTAGAGGVGGAAGGVGAAVGTAATQPGGGGGGGGGNAAAPAGGAGGPFLAAIFWQV